ncbi:MAG: Rab family GTPase [Candidatus Thorarchaeota archaeon]
MTFQVEDDTWCFKVIIAGEASVGKTTLINQYIAGKFTSEYKATIGVDIFTKEVTMKKDGKDHIVKLLVWDVAGQTLFRNFRKKFFSNSRGGFLVFDLTVPNSLDRLHLWIEDIYAAASDDIPLFLIGNKLDLEELIAISTKEVTAFLDQYPNIVSNFNTSALNGENVEIAFHSLITHLI